MLQSSPFGYDKYELTLGLWQPINVLHNDVNIIAIQSSTFFLLPVMVLSVPQFLDQSVESVKVNCPVDEPLNSTWGQDGTAIECRSAMSPTVNNKSVEYQMQSLVSVIRIIYNVQYTYSIQYTVYNVRTIHNLQYTICIRAMSYDMTHYCLS